MKFVIDDNIKVLLDLVKIVYYKGQRDALEQTDTKIQINTPLSDEMAVDLLMRIEEIYDSER